MAEAPGTRLGHYRVIAPIGSGGFATVYRAVDERLEADVAIKVLAENHALDVAVRERFIAEAQLLRRLSDPSVVAVHDIGETDRSQPFIVLEYADRADLRSRVAEYRAAGRRPDTDDVLVVARTLATALGRAHQAGLVHRDVTPDNLLITSVGGPPRTTPGILASGERLLLGDLGLAKDLVAGSGLTAGGGTHGFSSPEQRTGPTLVDPRADIFGASAVVFWLLTGTAPPDDPVQRQDALSASGVAATTTQALQRGLAADPRTRFATIAEWYEALAESDPHTPTATTTPPRAAPQTATRTRTRPRLVAAASLLIGATLASAAWWALDGRDGTTVTALANGQVRVERQIGAARGAVFGPATASVGQQVTFQAAVSDGAAFRWITPDGQIHDGNPLVVTASRAGRGRVNLLISDAEGRAATVEFDFEVTS